MVHASSSRVCTHPAPSLPILPGWLQVGRVKPFCMFTGSEASPIYRWLAEKGVTMIQVGTQGSSLPVCLVWGRCGQWAGWLLSQALNHRHFTRTMHP